MEEKKEEKRRKVQKGTGQRTIKERIGKINERYVTHARGKNSEPKTKTQQKEEKKKPSTISTSIVAQALSYHVFGGFSINHSLNSIYYFVSFINV